MMLQKFWGLILLLLVAGSVAAVFWFNFSQINDLLLSFGGESLRIEQPVFPAASSTPETVADSGTDEQPGQIVQDENPLAAAGTPDILVPEEKKVSAPAVSEMPQVLSQNQITGNGALTRNGVVAATNEQRRIYSGAGFDLKENNLLDVAAQNKVNDMFAGQYFDHVSPAGNNAAYFIGSTGYEYIAIGENLALGDYVSDGDLVQAWMNSPGHRENILKAGYKEIGVAVGYGMFNGRKTWLAVQEFGIPGSACPRIDAGLSSTIDRDRKTIDQFSRSQSLLLARINEEKNRIQALEKEIDGLAGSKASSAVIMAKQQEVNLLIDQANKDVASYNNNLKGMKSEYDSYKTNIGEYNRQVNAYNACANALE